MECALVATLGSWRYVKMAADTTRKKCSHQYLPDEPTDSWKRKMAISEHSCLRMISYVVKWYDIPYWASVHLVRHHIGFQPFVFSQRDDLNGKKGDRGEKRQDEPVDVMAVINAQALINISKFRLCHKTSTVTREAVKIAIATIRLTDTVIPDACVPSCVYRGFCPEISRCNVMSNSDMRNLRAIYTGKMMVATL